MSPTSVPRLFLFMHSCFMSSHSSSAQNKSKKNLITSFPHPTTPPPSPQLSKQAPKLLAITLCGDQPSTSPPYPALASPPHYPLPKQSPTVRPTFLRTRQAHTAQRRNESPFYELRSSPFPAPFPFHPTPPICTSPPLLYSPAFPLKEGVTRTIVLFGF